MGHKFAEIAFTDSVRQLQQAGGSRDSYARIEAGSDRNGVLTDREADFIGRRDSFYMATVSETGWPYVQHRGGPPGFVRVLDPKTLGFPDFSGNRQFVSTGNLRGDDRISLFFMDYPNRARLKLLGRAQVTHDPAILEGFAMAGYSAKIDRAFVIDVAAFDWNCPQHITPRFTTEDVAAAVAPLQARIAELEAALAVRA